MKKLAKILAVLFLTISSGLVHAQDLPQPSPHATFTQTVGVTDISMDYSRPAVRGRVIWGELVPYNQVWRAGANASTKITFSTDVKIENTTVPAGTYAMYIIPNEAEWTFIISNYVDGWGVDEYTEASDVVRVNAKVEAHEMTENMLFSIDKITDNSAVLSLQWEKIKVGFPIEIDTKQYADKNLKEAVAKADGSYSVYNKAAAWKLKNNEDVEEALRLAQKSTSQQKKFWNMTVLAEAYFANGDKKMAIKTAKEAMEMSEKAGYDSYVKRNQKNIEDWSK